MSANHQSIPTLEFLDPPITYFDEKGLDRLEKKKILAARIQPRENTFLTMQLYLKLIK